MDERSAILIALGLLTLMAGTILLVLGLMSMRAHGAADRIEAAFRASAWLPLEGETPAADWRLRPWMQDLAALGFEPLGQVRPVAHEGSFGSSSTPREPPSRGSWIVPGRVASIPTFTDGSAVETMLACPAVHIDQVDLKVHTLDRSTDTRSGLRKHQLAVAAFAGERGAQTVTGVLETWLQHDTEHRQSFALVHAEG